MKALTIWQPWASLIADGHKHFETRSWPTKYRGPLLICAAMRRVDLVEAANLAYFAGLHPSYALWLPLGNALCQVQLTDCLPVTHPSVMAETLDGSTASIVD